MKMSIRFHNFWGDFDANDNVFLEMLNARGFEVIVEPDLNKIVDLQIVSVFRPPKSYLKRFLLKIVNKFAGYNYFELGDFLHPIMEIFDGIGLIGIVSFTKEQAELSINDVDGGGKIFITSPFGSAALKGCHEVQNIGAVETYQRRYLWVTAMEIVEHDALDSSAPLKEEKIIITPTQGAQENIPIEELRYLEEVAIELIAMCEQGDPKAAWVKLESESLDSEQKVALWTLLPSKVRSALKKAKEM
jgi:hypothetical protein